MSQLNNEMLLQAAQPSLGKIKVCFFVYFPSVWDSHKYVYEAMKASDAFDVYVLLAPVRNEHDSFIYAEDALNFFTEQGIDYIQGVCLETMTAVNLEALNMDVIFYQTPFYFGVEEWFVEHIAEYARIAYIPYGMYIGGIQGLQFNLIIHNIAWKVFAETELHKRLYAKYKVTGDDNVIVSGYPKLDIYNKEYNLSEAEYMWKIPRSKNPNIKRILWTPHWIIHKETKYTLFTDYIDFFLNYLETHHDTVEIILKPHPILFSSLITAEIYTPEELDDIITRFNSLPNGSIYTGGNYYPLFFSSDAMINSSISFIVEYLPTKKPMLFMPNINDLGTNEFGALIRDKHYMGYSTKDIEDFIDNIVIQGKDDMYDARMEAIANILYLPEEGAATKIAREIEQSIHSIPEWQHEQRLLRIRKRLLEKKQSALMKSQENTSENASYPPPITVE